MVSRIFSSAAVLRAREACQSIIKRVAGSDEAITTQGMQEISPTDFSFVQDILKHKDSDINLSELDQVAAFREQLNGNSKLQKDLQALTNEELRLFLCHCYVESAHVLDPLDAFNIKDKAGISESDLKYDDNLMMLKGYAHMLPIANSLIDNESLDKKKVVQDAILQTISILTKGDPAAIKDISDSKKGFYGGFDFEYVGGEELWTEIEATRNQAVERTLGYGDRFQVKSSTAMSKGIEYRTLLFGVPNLYGEDRIAIFSNLASRLADAITDRDQSEIYKITMDLCNLHFFPNANGRLSQILRDCLNIAMGFPPYKALQIMSRDMYFDKKPDKEHLGFMQEHSTEILKAIQNKDFSMLEGHKLADQFIQKHKNTENQAIKKDIANYYHNLKNPVGLSDFDEKLDVTFDDHPEFDYSSPTIYEVYRPQGGAWTDDDTSD